MRPSSNMTADSTTNEGPQEREEWMDPSTIKFSQETISHAFSRRPLQRLKANESHSPDIPRITESYSVVLKSTHAPTLHETLQQLKAGTLTVKDIPRIRVVKYEGNIYSLDNRRLWVFRAYGQAIPVLVQEEPCKEFFRKLSLGTDCNTVRVLGPGEKYDKFKDSESFRNIVLQWSAEDVLNERMYINKVQPIPMRFPDLQTYYKAFQWPLLEETRGKLKSCFEEIGSAPYMSLSCVEELPESSLKSQLKKFKLTTSNGRKFVERCPKDAQWQPKPTDLVVLCTLVPESVEDLLRSGEFYTLALMISGGSEREPEDNVDDSPVSFKVLVWMHPKCPEFREILEGKRSWYAVFLENVATALRIWDALNPDLSDLKNDKWQLVRETLYRNAQEEGTSAVEHKAEDALEAVVEEYCHYRQLNLSQTEAVRCTVMGLLNGKSSRLSLIQGPPGTGKTSTVTALISVVTSFKNRTIVCAPTNRAVCEVAERFLQNLESSLANNCQCADFTSPVSIGMRVCETLQIGDVLMIGNEDKVDADGILNKIFLPNRINRLLEALAPHSGWRHCAQNVRNFLRDALEEFGVYVELWHENKANERPLLDFLQFIRERLSLLGRKMIDNGHTMCNDLPGKLLNSRERKTIRDSCEALESLLQSLSNANLKAGEAKVCWTSTCLSKCNQLCTARQQVLDLMSGEPGYFIKEFRGATPAASVIEEICMGYSCLMFSTTSAAGRRSVRISGPFDYAVIDEAAQLVEAETAIVTQLPGIKQILLVGDPKQLQALVTSQIAKDSGYGRSLFDRLQTLGHTCQMLNVQYRMHPQISQFPNRQFYNGAVNDGPNVLSAAYKQPFQELYGPYVFIDVKDGEEEKDENDRSWKNRIEVEVVHNLLSKIRALSADKCKDVTVGVISPYKGQVELLKKLLDNSRMSCRLDSTSKAIVKCHVDVKTVDGFQGGEKDVILFSAVRANVGGHIGFLDDARRLNVALTRGRYCVWVIGNGSTLAAQGGMWGDLISDAKSRLCYKDARDDIDLKKAILRAKKELEQFASLLHHDSILFGDSLWKVLFSKEFKETITRIKSTQTRQTILNTILNLANGRRPPYPTKCSLVEEAFIKMIHVQPTGGFTLVWTVDVQKFSPFKQVIKIWDAVESSHIVGLIRRLEAGFRTYTPAYIERCSTVKLQTKTSKNVVPTEWKEHDSSFRWHQTAECVQTREDRCATQEFTLEKSNVEESILLMKFYSLTSGVARQLLTVRNGSNMELVFEVNEEEETIINYPFSTFILGRSGTGKTTVITTRLLAKEQALLKSLSGKPIEELGVDYPSKEDMGSCLARKEMNFRQAMITLSPKLCAAIKRHIVKASRTMAMGSADCTSTADDEDKEDDVMLDEEEESKLMGEIPDTLVNISSAAFPLVITFRKFLTMLNGSVSCPFLLQKGNQLDKSSNGERASFDAAECLYFDGEQETSSVCDSLRDDENPSPEEEGEDGKQHDTDEDEDPQDFLSDEDAVADEGDTVADEEDPVGENGSLGGSGSHESQKCDKNLMEVTFENFMSCYWPHLNQDLVKHFDSSVVFTEIISVIKGSLEALHTEKGRLTREQYLSLSVRKISNLDEQQRNIIYSIFLLYERKKSEKRDYDIADYCMHLYRQMRLGNYVGQKLHYVYVDEVQDLTMVQIALFKFVCLNIEKGYVFAGDTAQTIARGVSFRFQDIRHLFYTEFLGNSSTDVNDVNQTCNCCTVHDTKCRHHLKARRNLTAPMPVLHQLSHNFRTHVGVVRMANSIIQLLHHFFPNAVDKLEQETSRIQGDTPVFLEREENGNHVTSLFGHGGAAGGGGCDFGAEQVIVVRDMETKHRMVERLGKRGLVMSVLECKGLEFQDVLLYNFFTDSLLRTKWRVIYSYLAEKGKLEDMGGRPLYFPQFNSRKHNLLMSELKQLYVVVTRARQRLWIYDECPEHHKPMVDFWSQSGLIEVKHLDERLSKTMQGKSTSEDWKRRGIEMFNNHFYDNAELSFERAGDLHRAKWARAAGLQQAAERLQGSDSKAASQMFREAANLFLSLEKGEAAAKCYVKFGEHRMAGMIYQEKCKPPRWEDAGDCFLDAKCWKEAAEAFSKSSSIKKCLQACLRGKHLELGANYLCLMHSDGGENISTCASSVGRTPQSHGWSHGEELDDLKLDYLKKCALHYHKQKHMELMMKFVRQFPSVNAQKAFLKRRDCFDQLIEVEESEGNFIKAAEMAEAKGDLKHTITLLKRAGYYEQAVDKIIEKARFDMLWSGGKPGWPVLLTTDSEVFLKSAEDIASSSPVGIRSELLQEIQVLLFPDRGLANWDIAKNSNDLRLQIIAGRQAIDEILTSAKVMLPRLPTVGESLSAQVSQLVVIWDAWSQILISLIQALKRALMRRHTVEDEDLIQSSNVYLGVTKHSQSQLFLINDATSSWLRNSPVTVLPNQRGRCNVQAGLVFSLSETFWLTQLWQAGLEVLKILEAHVQNSYATNFCAQDVLPRGKLLWKLYSITVMLDEIMNSKAIQEGYLDLRNRLGKYGDMIYDMSFPTLLYHENFNIVIEFRNIVGTGFDSIATNLLHRILGSQKNAELKYTVFENVGKIQVLLPLLTKQWIKKHGPEIESLLLNKRVWGSLWQASYRLYVVMSEYLGELPETCSHWLKETGDYCLSLTNVWKGLRFSISPVVFMQMLERGIVMECACHTHLKSLILPRSLVVNHMTGINDICIYSAILNISCKKNCLQFPTLRIVLRQLLDLLETSTFEVKGWLKQFEIDFEDILPQVMFRLIVAVLTASINCFDQQILDMTRKALSNFFEKSPQKSVQDELVRTLPKAFMMELRNFFWSSKYTQVDQLCMPFMRAMEAVGNPLVALKRANQKIPVWAHRNKLQVIIIALHRDAMGRAEFHTSYAELMRVVAESKQVRKIEESVELQSLECEVAGHNSPQNIGVSSLPSDPGDSFDGDLFDGEEELVVNEELGDPSLGPERRTTPPGHVSIGEGHTVAMYIKERLLQRLEEARHRLTEELSATERHRRDSKISFCNQKIKSKEYMEVFLGEASPLKALIDEWLELLETSVQVLKDDSNPVGEEMDDTLLDDMIDSQETLQRAADILDPRNNEHRKADLNLLRVKLAEVQGLLQTGKEQLQGRIRILERACTRKNQVGASSVEKEAHGNRCQEKNRPKKKPRKKKKGKRW